MKKKKDLKVVDLDNEKKFSLKNIIGKLPKKELSDDEKIAKVIEDTGLNLEGIEDIKNNDEFRKEALMLANCKVNLKSTKAKQFKMLLVKGFSPVIPAMLCGLAINGIKYDGNLTKMVAKNEISYTRDEDAEGIIEDGTLYPHVVESNSKTYVRNTDKVPPKYITYSKWVKNADGNYERTISEFKIDEENIKLFKGYMSLDDEEKKLVNLVELFGEAYSTTNEVKSNLTDEEKSAKETSELLITVIDKEDKVKAKIPNNAISVELICFFIGIGIGQIIVYIPSKKFEDITDTVARYIVCEESCERDLKSLCKEERDKKLIKE